MQCQTGSESQGTGSLNRASSLPHAFARESLLFLVEFCPLRISAAPRVLLKPGWGDLICWSQTPPRDKKERQLASIRVADILELLARGASLEEVLEDYPYLESADIERLTLHQGFVEILGSVFPGSFVSLYREFHPLEERYLGTPA